MGCITRCVSDWKRAYGAHVFLLKNVIYYFFTFELSFKDGADMYQTNGLVIAIDLLKFQPIDNVYQIKGDFTDPSLQKHVINKLKEVSSAEFCISFK